MLFRYELEQASGGRHVQILISMDYTQVVMAVIQNYPMRRPIIGDLLICRKFKRASGEFYTTTPLTPNQCFARFERCLEAHTPTSKAVGYGARWLGWLKQSGHVQL